MADILALEQRPRDHMVRGHKLATRRPTFDHYLGSNVRRFGKRPRSILEYVVASRVRGEKVTRGVFCIVAPFLVFGWAIIDRPQKKTDLLID